MKEMIKYNANAEIITNTNKGQLIFVLSLHISYNCSCCLVAQSCPTLCGPVDYSPPGSSVHGVLQARTLPPPGDLSNPGIEPLSLASSALQVDSLPLGHQGSPAIIMLRKQSLSLTWAATACRGCCVTRSALSSVSVLWPLAGAAPL